MLSYARSAQCHPQPVRARHGGGTFHPPSTTVEAPNRGEGEEKDAFGR